MTPPPSQLPEWAQKIEQLSDPIAYRSDTDKLIKALEIAWEALWNAERMASCICRKNSYPEHCGFHHIKEAMSRIRRLGEADEPQDSSEGVR